MLSLLLLLLLRSTPATWSASKIGRCAKNAVTSAMRICFLFASYSLRVFDITRNFVDAKNDHLQSVRVYKKKKKLKMKKETAMAAYLTTLSNGSPSIGCEQCSDLRALPIAGHGERVERAGQKRRRRPSDLFARFNCRLKRIALGHFLLQISGRVSAARLRSPCKWRTGDELRHSDELGERRRRRRGGHLEPGVPHRASGDLKPPDRRSLHGQCARLSHQSLRLLFHFISFLVFFFLRFLF